MFSGYQNNYCAILTINRKDCTRIRVKGEYQYDDLNVVFGLFRDGVAPQSSH